MLGTRRERACDNLGGTGVSPVPSAFRNGRVAA
ncbi:hypothetical protein RAS1_11580 [Phycisphaerae bacterium RAS1]|nr:hypothetical protein RAS1_11580 [Phycisphaerae bacterium RAS1]